MLASSCASYKQNIMFTPGENTVIKEFDASLKIDKNYKIEVNDYLELQVFTKNGERIVDPDLVLTGNIPNAQNLRPQISYLVRENGFCRLPMVGDIELAGLTLVEAEKVLQQKFKEFYKEPYVNLIYTNKRVILLGGASGGEVIPLTNENMKISEVLALAKSIDNQAKAHNIRLLRQEEVFLIDFSTIEGYLKSDITVQTGDVIYIEPVRRPFNEFIRDNGPVISIFTSLVSLVAVLISIN